VAQDSLQGQPIAATETQAPDKKDGEEQFIVYLPLFNEEKLRSLWLYQLLYGFQTVAISEVDVANVDSCVMDRLLKKSVVCTPR
jgi:hypothetical protein